MKRTAALTGGAVAGAAFGGSARAAQAVRVPTAVLGRTGAAVSRLGIGCAHWRRERATADVVRETLFHALDLGVTYLDTAPNYDRPGSIAEEKMGHTIKEIRDKVFLVTKTEVETYEGTWELLRQSMKRLQTDHLDLVHLHNFGEESRFTDLSVVFSAKGALGALREAKKLGVIRFIGASGHLYPTRFHKALDTGEIDVLMNAVNFVIQHTYDFEHKVWARAEKENVGLVAMKVLGGEGAGDSGYQLPPERYEQAIRYSLSIPGCACSVIGIENVAELEQAAAAVANARPLTEAERLELAQAGLEIARQANWKAPYGTPLA